MVLGGSWLSPLDSTDERPPDAGPMRSWPLGRKSEVVLTATLVGCGLVGLIITYRPESVGVMGSAFALAAGILIFLQGRAFARSNCALKRQAAVRGRAQGSEGTSQEELSRILASVGECLWSLTVSADGALNRLHLSPEFEQLTGYPVEFFSVQDIVDEPWLRLIVPEDRQRVRTIYESLALGPSLREVCEYRLTRSDGEIIWIRDNCVVTRHSSGAAQYDGIMTDITASKRAEGSERRSRDELARILASVGECLWSTRIDPSGRIESDFISPALEDICGYPPEQIKFPDHASGLEVDDPWMRLIVPEDRHWLADAYQRAFEGTLDRLVFEYRITRSDGEIAWVRDNWVATRHPSGAIQLDGVLTDVTAQKRAEVDQQKLEERIRQTQKLESIGVLAGGIAHDFNNLLVVIMGNADLAVSAASCPSHIRESLQEIESASQRASGLCRELLVYSGRAPYVTAPIDLGELVQEMEMLLGLANSPGIRIETDFPEEIALIDADAAQLRQLVMNLITNAVDSITGGSGRIQISIEKCWCEEADLANTFTHESLPAGEYVLLSVSDTGCGMAEETLSRIFDPFFTTKFTGRGLGLAAALGIVRGHHGAISVTSELGVGTRTLVHLPALMTKRVEPATSAEEPVAWQPSGVVLLVDDEDAVRSVGSLMLERLGVKVLSAASGEDALRILDSGLHDLRCVILDLMMPGLSGTDTLRAIREKNQNLPVLIVTGYGESDAIDLLGELSATGLLTKPFTSEELEVALRAALGE